MVSSYNYDSKEAVTKLENQLANIKPDKSPQYVF